MKLRERLIQCSPLLIAFWWGGVVQYLDPRQWWIMLLQFAAGWAIAITGWHLALKYSRWRTLRRYKKAVAETEQYLAKEEADL